MPRKSPNKDNDKDVSPSDAAVKNALKVYLEDYKKRKIINHENIEIITSVLEEFLQTFLVIGYNYEGEMIYHTHAKTQVQMDALNTSIFKFLHNNAIKYPPEGPVDGYKPF